MNNESNRDIESQMTENQRNALQCLRGSPGVEVRIQGVTGSALVDMGFAERVVKPTIHSGRGYGIYVLKP